MAHGLGEQFENLTSYKLLGKRAKRGSNKWYKTSKSRKERRRAKNDPECQPWYKRFRGFEF